MGRAPGSLDNNAIIHLVMIFHLDSLRKKVEKLQEPVFDVEGFQKMSSSVWFASGLNGIVRVFWKCNSSVFYTLFPGSGGCAPPQLG